MSLPFEDSRRLTGANLYFAQPGAVLETAPGMPVDAALIAAWRTRVAQARAALGWPDAPIVARTHAHGASLAFAAPIDQLYTATEVNEWAWEACLLPPGESAPKGRMREKHSPPIRAMNSQSKLPFDDATLAFVRTLRRCATTPEQLIWQFIRNRRLHGAKFRRQQAIGPYVLDFYCHELKLAVELDGGQHNDSAQAAHDAKRNTFLAEQGIATLRYWNNEVLDHAEAVLGDIWQNVERQWRNNPSPKGRGVRVKEKLADIRLTSQLGDALPSSGADAPPSPDGRREAPYAPGHAAIWDDTLALYTLQRLARSEARPELIALIDQADRHHLPWLLDDDALTLGSGDSAQSWPLDALPSPSEIEWSKLRAILTALVTGSNGKTTTVRLVAAMLEAHGLHCAYSCTEGVFVGDRAIASGDYSGPMGARSALRQPDAQAAVLETARGGILRRGLAVTHADVAIVTKISADHFGEYGIDTLADLADAKLVVARALDADAPLVLNADDAQLVERAATLANTLAWFALDADHVLLIAQRARGGSTCGVRAGELLLHRGGIDHALGSIAAMPLTFNGSARYNIANIAGAALVADALGVSAENIAQVLMRFGADNADNPGRLMRWTFAGITVLVDYAHNPDGLAGLLKVAQTLRHAMAPTHAVVAATPSPPTALSSGERAGVRGAFDLDPGESAEQSAPLTQPSPPREREGEGLSNQLAHDQSGKREMAPSPPTALSSGERAGVRGAFDLDPCESDKQTAPITQPSPPRESNGEGLNGRLALVLGQAGNREDEDIRELAVTAASFHPDLIVLKDIESFLRGRQSGEIAKILKAELLLQSIPEQAILTCLDEVEAARATLAWARAGDVLVLPIHDKQARNAVVALLDQLAASKWIAGLPLPTITSAG